MERTANLTFSDNMLQLLNNCKGKQLDQISYISFSKENQAFGKLALYFEEQNLEIANIFTTVALDSQEDYAQLKISAMKSPEFTPSLPDSDFTHKRVNDVLQEIQIVTDTIQWENRKEVYTLIIDVAIVLFMNKTVIVLQKDIWFSEEIIIYLGADYEKQLLPIDLGWDFEEKAKAIFERKIRNI